LPEIVLRVTLAKGASIRIQMASDWTRSLFVKNRETRTKIVKNLDLLLELEKVEGGRCDFRAQIKGLGIRRKGPSGAIDYDSAARASATDPWAAGYAALVGGTFTLTVDDRARMQEISGVEEMLSAAAGKAVPGKKELRASVEAALRKDFGPKVIRDWIQQSLFVFPEEAIRRRHRWGTRTSLLSEPGLAYANDFALNKRRAGKITFQVRSSITPASPTLHPLKGSEKTEVSLDEQRGWPFKIERDRQLRGKSPDGLGTLTLLTRLTAQHKVSKPDKK
jgi:hypothetical protein